MKQLNNYIIEKLVINKHTKPQKVDNINKIGLSLEKIFKDNKAFTKNSKQIKKYITELLNNWNKDYKDYGMEAEYIINCQDHDDFKEYIKKFNIDDSDINFIDDTTNILNTYFNGNENKQMTKKYVYNQQYFNIYVNETGIIWIDSSLSGSDIEDIMSI